MKKTIYLFSLLCSSVAIPAMAQTEKADPSTFGGRKQYRTWSIGLNGGAVNPYSFIGPFNKNLQEGREYNFGYGLSIQKQIDHNFSLRLDGFRVDGVEGRQYVGGEGAMVNDFNNLVKYSATASGVFNTGSIDFLKRKNVFSFYGSLGGGIINYDNSTKFTDPVTGKVTDGRKIDLENFIVPVGVGIKIRTSDRVYVGIGHTVTFVDQTEFDGVNGNGVLDRFSYSYASLILSLGKKERYDLEFVNPVAVMYDDLDIRAEVDKKLSDMDAKFAPMEAKINKIMMDSDNDGVSDVFDKEPNTAVGAIVDGAGRSRDTDGDGIADNLDKCPTQKGPAPDGCPVEVKPTIVVLTKEEVQVVQTAFRNIEFETNKAILKQTSFASLKDLATLLKNKPNYKIRITGHTDSDGTNAANKKLSEDRAASVKEYLAGSGAGSDQMVSEGKGEEFPIATNKNAAGKQKNRRVELEIFQ